MAEEEGGRGIRRVLMSIVGSGRGSLLGGSGGVTLLGGSIRISLLGARRLGGSLMSVLDRCKEFIVFGGSMGRKHRR